jgi:hypothetical protein
MGAANVRGRGDPITSARGANHAKIQIEGLTVWPGAVTVVLQGVEFEPASGGRSLGP